MQPSDDLDRECGPDPAGDRGPVVPIAPDPDRDARVTAYRDRERRRAARALDRFIDLNLNGGAGTTVADAAGERFVEQVGDYVLARLDGMLPDGFHVEINTDPIQHKGHYGVAETAVPDHSATQRDLAHATMPHPTCQDVSRLDEGLGTRWVCTDRCPR